jgi:hypothetical protein
VQRTLSLVVDARSLPRGCDAFGVVATRSKPIEIPIAGERMSQPSSFVGAMTSDP